MNIREIAPGLCYRTAPHPDWGGAADWPEDVGCVCYEAPDTTIFIDPLVPKGEEDEFWAALDRWVEPRGLPVSVLLTAPWHQRSAPLVAERYGVIVWAHESAQSRLTFPVRSGPLPTGVEAFVPGGASEGQVAFFLQEPRALVVAEFFMGVDGGLRALPSPAVQDSNAFYDSLRRLLDLPIEHVLVAHGEPVLGEGRKRIAEALGSDG